MSQARLEVTIAYLFQLLVNTEVIILYVGVSFYLNLCCTVAVMIPFNMFFITFQCYWYRFTSQRPSSE